MMEVLRRTFSWTHLMRCHTTYSFPPPAKWKLLPPMPTPNEEHQNIRALTRPTERPLKGQDISGSVKTPSGKGHASDTQPGTNTPRTTSPESDATVINTDPAKPLTPASTEQLSGRVLVPASSPFVTKALVNAGEKVQTQDEIDDVEPADESIDGDEESDPIEPEPNEPSVDLPAPRLSTDPVPRHLRRPASRATLDPSSELEQPSRRSGRLANRRTSLATSEATPVLARRPDRKASLSLKKSAAKENLERTHNAGMVEETTQEISTRKQDSKGRKFARQATQRSTNPDETLVQDHGSAQASNSQVEWTTLAPPSETQADGSSPIDELRQVALVLWGSYCRLGMMHHGQQTSERIRPCPFGEA
ncbi:hypothetical protein EDB85DRAFT_74803 [Lactarius pseudohatsudake]|nr:hypothetical protein EDB85DRAFT_74803 [Lactarius pseudohatsudake]